MGGRFSGRPYPVLVDDIHDDNEPPVVLAVVDEGHAPDLHVPLENLWKNPEEEELRAEEHQNCRSNVQIEEKKYRITGDGDPPSRAQSQED